MRKILLGMLIFIVPAISVGQGHDSGRGQGWDFSVAGIYQRPDVAGGQGGSSLDVDDAWGIGFNIGYNFSNRLSVSADFDFLRPDYKAALVDENDPTNIITVDHTLSQFNSRFKGTFNFTDGPFVPYIEAGFGWTNVDSNVAPGVVRLTTGFLDRGRFRELRHLVSPDGFGLLRDRGRRV